MSPKTHSELAGIVIGTLFGVILVGGLIFLLKLLIIHIHSMRSSPIKESDKTTQYAKLLLLVLLLAMTTGLFVFEILMFGFPGVMNRIPLFWRMLGAIGLFVYWGCFAGLVYGLGKTVGAGAGSATTTLNRLFGMISDVSFGTKERVGKHKADEPDVNGVWRIQ